MQINNLQSNRTILIKSNVKKYLDEKFIGSKILISNYGFIVISKNKSEKVKKYYIAKEFFEKELSNYSFLKGNINLPDIEIFGEIIIEDIKLYLIEYENIRISKGRFNNIIEIGTKDIGELLGKLHGLKFNNGDTYLHGNLHPSNFFINKKGELGIFDFVGMLYGRIEYDFMIIYISSDFDDVFLEDILNNYKYKKYFRYKTFYKFILERLINDIKLNRPYHKVGIEILKKALIKIKFKLGNLT